MEDWREAVKRGEKIDPAKHGVGCTGDKGTPKAKIYGKEVYRRIFVRLRTPQETLTCRPIEDGADFAARASIIENWFNSVVRKGNYVLTFYAEQVSDEVADEMERQNNPLRDE